jgi:RHS repeat-associated protein
MRINQYLLNLIIVFLLLLSVGVVAQTEYISDITIGVGQTESYNNLEQVETSGNVVVDGNGSSGGSLTINARNSIILKPGFVVNKGGSFNATVNNTMILRTDEDLNWTQQIAYDENGTPISWSKSYVDELGRPMQSQTFSFENYQAVVSQSVYDNLGRATITSMAVPVTQNKLQYLPNFIQDANGEEFELDNDVAVADGENQLGWYYSSNNPEDYVDHSSIPYSRVEYSLTQPGVVRKSAMPGEAHKMGSGHEVQTYTMTAAEGELSGFVNLDANVEYKNIVKTINVDADGKQSVVYTSEDGKTVASCLVGEAKYLDDGFYPQFNSGSLLYTLSSENNFGYLDFHIPQGGAMKLRSSGTYKIVDLSTDELVVNKSFEGPMYTGPSFNLEGFYRIIRTDSNADFNISIIGKYTNHSLNVYDDAGRLKKSYTPMATENNDPTYCTEYFYNSLGWLTKTESKDEGISHFVYRADGQILFSQNAQQKIDGKFSYSMYDSHGRVIESGEYDESKGSLNFWNSNSIALSETDELSPSLRDDISVSCLTQRHRIWYGEDGNQQNQDFVLGAISKTEYDGNITYYSYTYDGKVDWVIRDHAYLGAKKIDYTYDFLGNVKEVAYQRGGNDQFIHTYEYNKDQIITAVYTQRGAGAKQLQAKYKYYVNGTLKRVEMAENQQGVDYVYNINGMLKSINHPNLDKNLDPGKDGSNGFREDLFALALDYYAGDYNGGGNIKTSSGITSNYNGNIAMVRWNQFNNKASGAGQQWGYKVGYNERNYLSEAVFGEYSHGTNSFTKDVNDNYAVNNITYDVHGNIKTLKRNAYGSYKDMDNLTYNYSSGNANRLSYISDAYGNNTTLQDIASQSSGNYQYNNIGQLTSNAADNISFNYDVTGKVSSYTLPGGTGAYYYDDAGFRSTVETVTEQRTHYVRDLSGNIMAVYNEGGDPIEYPIYGSDRIGIAYETDGTLAYNYELKDHLGNVRATFSKDDLTDATGYADYYPFGWKMPGRMSTAANKYRFGYQGQFSEYDDETGLNQFEARLYDNRIGRWLTTDPAHQFASPYLAMGNTPFVGVDPDGRWKRKWQAIFWNTFYWGKVSYAKDKQEWGIFKPDKNNGATVYRLFDAKFNVQLKGDFGIDIGIGLKVADKSIGYASLTSFNLARSRINIGALKTKTEDNFGVGLSLLDSWGTKDEVLRMEKEKLNLFGVGWDGGEYAIKSNGTQGDTRFTTIREGEWIHKPKINRVSTDASSERWNLDVSFIGSAIVKVGMGVHISARKW